MVKKKNLYIFFNNKKNVQKKKTKGFFSSLKSFFNDKENENHAAVYYVTKSIDMIRPLLDLQRVRRKGRNFYIPYEIKKEKSRVQAMKWLKEGSQKNAKGPNTLGSKALSLLLLESLKSTGFCLKKQKEHHTLAHSNRSYLRFRWW